MSRRSCCSWFILLPMLAATSPIQAQLRDRSIPPPPPADLRPSPHGVGRELQIAGEILRTKQVDDRTTHEKILVAQLDERDGGRRLVDLGPSRIYKNAPIYSGEQIVVYGPEVRLGNANVVLATEVHVAGDKVVVPRDGVMPLAGYVVEGPEMKLYGRIEALRAARLRDSRIEHWIARIVDRDGAPTVVDLGPQAALWRADLRTGDWVTIYGPFMKVGDDRVLLAREINKTGIPYLIERELVSEGAARSPVVLERAPKVAP